MVSQGWKILVLAPVLAIALTACQKNKKKDAAGSPYTGIWVSDEAWTTYVERRGSADFCRVVHANPHLFGVMNGEIHLDSIAICVQESGHVYKYTPRYNSADHAYREQYRRGVVAGNGLFRSRHQGGPGMGIGPAGYSAYGRNSYSDLAEGTTFIRNGRQLTLLNNGGRGAYYTYASENDIKAYMAEIASCNRGVVFEDVPRGPRRVIRERRALIPVDPREVGPQQGQPPQGRAWDEDEAWAAGEDDPQQPVRK